MAGLVLAEYVADNAIAEHVIQQCTSPSCERWRAQLERIRVDDRVFAGLGTRDRIVAPRMKHTE